MNATARRVLIRARGLAMAGGLAFVAGGCVSYDPFDPVTDPTSPAAGRVDLLAEANTAFPRWSDFPAAPTEVPSASDIRERVRELEVADAVLARQVAQINWLLGLQDLEPWAAATRARIDPRLSAPADPNALAEAEAWAERLRRRAVPPPPIEN